LSGSCMLPMVTIFFQHRACKYRENEIKVLMLPEVPAVL
jgi:hypothetical protein